MAAGWGETLPEELVFGILVWLPVASLLRFKSVCKSWLSYINTPHFISQHTRCDRGDDRLIILHDSFDYPNLCFSFISAAHLRLSEHVRFPTPEEYTFARVVSSFHGLICLKYSVSVGYLCNLNIVSLWNPATKEFLVPPPPPLSYIDKNEDTIWDMEQLWDIEYGFGFDATTNNYKIVRFILQNCGPYPNSFHRPVEIFSLSTGCWRAIDAIVPSLMFSVSSYLDRPFLNQIYCWAGVDEISQCYLILSFNFSNEEFRIIPLPEINDFLLSDDPVMNDFLVLTILRDKIAFIHCKRSGSYNVWILDEYGENESWTKLYSITNDLVFAPLRFSVDGKLIFLLKGRKRLCFYNPLTDEGNDVLIPWEIYDIANGMYKESLISVKSPNGVMMRLDYESLEVPIGLLNDLLLHPPPESSEVWLEFLESSDEEVVPL